MAVVSVLWHKPRAVTARPHLLLAVEEQKVRPRESQQHLSVLHSAPPRAQLGPPRPLPTAPS